MEGRLGGQVELVVASGKGGVGKSTLTAVLAVELYRHGYNLVAVDADAEAPNLHIVLGVESWDEESPYTEGRIAYIKEELCTQCGVCAEVCPYDAVEVVEGRHVINKWLCEGCLTCALACPEKAIRFIFKVKAGVIRVARETPYGFPLVSGEIVPGRPNSGKLVTEAKNRAKSILGGDGLVLVDAAAGIGCQVISSLTGAKIAVLVAEPTPASFSDLKRIHKLTRHFMIAPGLVINKYDINPDYVDIIREYARENNIPILGEIPYDDAVPKSIVEGKPLHEAYPDSPAAKAMTRISQTIAVDVLGSWRDWWRKYKPARPEPYIPGIK
ncbi:MAG: ATP-binding protein [Desulfurococcales archaeon]|nr:ATP-binding protein [Desulfurococcales archaeon]